MTDSGSLDKGVLGTIDERKAHTELNRLSGTFVAPDVPNKQSLTPKRQRQNLTQLDLRRRNSDPATKVLLNDSGKINNIHKQRLSASTRQLSLKNK